MYDAKLLKLGWLMWRAARSVVSFPLTMILALGAISRVPSADNCPMTNRLAKSKGVKNLMLVRFGY